MIKSQVSAETIEITFNLGLSQDTTTKTNFDEIVSRIDVYAWGTMYDNTPFYKGQGLLWDTSNPSSTKLILKRNSSNTTWALKTEVTVYFVNDAIKDSANKSIGKTETVTMP